MTALRLALITLTAVATVAGDALSTLRQSVSSLGQVLLPGDASFDSHAQLWNPAWDGRTPAVIVAAAAEGDVVAAVQYAHATRLHLRVKSGGHQSFGASVCPTATCVVVDVSRLHQIVVDNAAMTAVIGSGAKQRAVFEKLNPLNLTMNYASGGSISMGGLIQGGGFGISTRLHSVLSDSVVAARVVRVDSATVVTATATNGYADLFWALCGGGGGQYAIVLSFTLKVYPLAPLSGGNITRFSYTFSAGEANITRVNEGFQDWLAVAPHEFQPFIGWSATGGLSVHGFYHGSLASFSPLFSEFLRLAGRPDATGTADEMPFGEAYLGWLGADDDRSYLSLITVMVRRVTAEGMQILFEASRSYSAGVHALVASTGQVAHGQLGGSGPVGAYSLREYTFSVIMSKQMAGAAANLAPWREAVASAMSAYQRVRALGDRVYVNSPLQTADLPSWAEAYYGDNWRILRAVKAKYDNGGLLAQPQDLATYGPSNSSCGSSPESLLLWAGLITLGCLGLALAAALARQRSHSSSPTMNTVLVNREAKTSDNI